MTYKIYKPFGPQILETEIPSEIILKINEYIDNLVLDEEKSKKQNYRLIFHAQSSRSAHLNH